MEEAIHMAKAVKMCKKLEYWLEEDCQVSDEVLGGELLPTYKEVRELQYQKACETRQQLQLCSLQI